MENYINIHTHHSTNFNAISVVNNRFGFDKHLYTKTAFSIGIHPWDINVITDILITEFESYITHTNCVAIGECGIDKNVNTITKHHISIFEMQLMLAQKYNKPLIVHCVKAFAEVTKLCKPFLNSIPIIIHGYNKSQKMAEDLIDKGFYISINHLIITKKDFDLNCIPLNKLFLETDNNPLITIDSIYRMVSTKLKIDETTLIKQFYKNFKCITHGN